VAPDIRATLLQRRPDNVVPTYCYGWNRKYVSIRKYRVSGKKYLL